jgi:hypothetical protein
MGTSGISAQTVALVVKHTAERAGFDPAGLAAHSLPSGLATTAARNGAGERSIMRLPLWRVRLRWSMCEFALF